VLGRDHSCFNPTIPRSLYGIGKQRLATELSDVLSGHTLRAASRWNHAQDPHHENASNKLARLLANVSILFRALNAYTTKGHAWQTCGLRCRGSWESSRGCSPQFGERRAGVLGRWCSSGKRHPNRE